MFRLNKALLVAVCLVIICGQSAIFGAEDQLTCTVVGRAEWGLQVAVPQPVKEGTLLTVYLYSGGPMLGEAMVQSCTREWPYIALAKTVRGDIQEQIPIGAVAYADAGAVIGETPKPLKQPKRADSRRFSLQAGAFRPEVSLLQDTVGEYWQSHRLSYSFLKIGNFESLVSAEYARGSGEFISDGATAKRSIEMIPVTALAKFRPLRVGSVSLFVGAGAGMYRIKSEDTIGGTTTASSIDKFGHELATGLEFNSGWIAELRYRNVQDTNIKGYSLGIGGRF